MTDTDKVINPQHLGSDPAEIQIRKSGLKSPTTFG